MAFELLKGEIDGRPIIVMVNGDARNRQLQKKYPYFLSVGSEIRESNEHGLPSASEAEDLNHWEDQIESTIKSVVDYVYVGRVTFHAQRELLFYLAHDAAIGDALNNHNSVRSFGFRCHRDEHWITVKPYLDGRLPGSKKKGFLARLLGR